MKVIYTATNVQLQLIAQEYVDPTFTATGTIVDGDRGLPLTQSATVLTNAFNTINAAITAETGPLPNPGIVTVNSVGTGTTYTETGTTEFPAGNTVILSGDSTGTFTPNITITNGITLDDATKLVYRGTLAATRSAVRSSSTGRPPSASSSAASLFQQPGCTGGG